MILGSDTFVGGTGRFYRQIVNGPFDADKLDYLPRDGYHTGLEIVVDIERLLNTITVVEKDSETEIAVVSSGAIVLEQVLFSKTQLYASMYHHHKVRAAHQLIQLLIHTMLDRNYKPAGLDLKDPISYIALDDHDLLQSGHNDHDVKSIVQKIKMRVFPMRALVITHPCFDDQENRGNFITLTKSNFETIAHEAERELRLPNGSIIFDAPEQPRLDGTGKALVELAPGREPLPLQELYPAGAWAKAYAGYRRMTYVFTTASDLRSVGIKVQSILASSPYNIRLNDNALALAKL
jgi:HD superfamily phosphohydrolase